MKKEEADWILRIDIVEKGSKLEVRDFVFWFLLHFRLLVGFIGFLKACSWIRIRESLISMDGCFYFILFFETTVVINQHHFPCSTHDLLT